MARPRTAQLDVMEAARAITRERLQAQQHDGLPPGVTWRDLRDALLPRQWRAGAVRSRVKYLARTGQLRPVGTVRVPDSMRPLQVYAPADDVPAPVPVLPGAALANAMRGWATA